MKKKILIIVILLVVLCVMAIKVFELKKNNVTLEISKNATGTVEEVEKAKVEIKNESFTETEVDKSAIEIEKNSEGSIKDVVVDKKGDSSDVTESDKKGLNAAVKVNQTSNISIENLQVTSDGKGATGVASVGRESVIKIKDSNIETKADRAKGILATRRGSIYAENLNIRTTGFKSSAIATDMGGGIIEIKNSIVETNDVDSVGIYATGNIKAENLKINTNKAEALCIDGSGTIDVINSELITGKKRGAMIYYTGPSQHSNNLGKISMKNGLLKVNEGPAFYVMNSSGEITVENVNIETKSGIFLQASVDVLGELGQEGAPVQESNGGNAKVTATNQKIKGDIIVDEKSTVTLELKNGSSFEGAIDSKNTGISVDVTLGEGCTWTLTGNSYVTTLNKIDDTQINLNGYKIFYKTKE